MYWLVVYLPTPLKNGVNVSWDDEIPNIWKNKSKPPTIKYLSFKNSMIGYQSCIRFSFDDPSELGGKHFFVGLPVTSLVSRLLSCCRSKSLIAIYLPCTYLPSHLPNSLRSQKKGCQVAGREAVKCKVRSSLASTMWDRQWFFSAESYYNMVYNSYILLYRYFYTEWVKINQHL